MTIKEFYDQATGTISYVVFDEETKDAVVIDPVFNYNPIGSLLTLEATNAIIEFLRKKYLKLYYIMETHAHADHISGAQIIKEQFPNAKIAIGKNITKVQEVFRDFFNLGNDFPVNGIQFDKLLSENEILTAGSLQFKVIFTPGHTPACASYLIEDVLFTGDAIFLPDIGTGRCDFPLGSAEVLYDSIVNKIFSLPEQTKIYVAHDYPPQGRTVAPYTTVAESKRTNKDLRLGISKKDFVHYRTMQDKTLAAPRLLFQSVQININAGKLPDPKKNGIRYLNLPIHLPTNK